MPKTKQQSLDGFFNPPKRGTTASRYRSLCFIFTHDTNALALRIILRDEQRSWVNECSSVNHTQQQAAGDAAARDAR